MRKNKEVSVGPCHACGKIAACRPVATPVKMMAVLTLAFVHCGYFASTELAHDYCRSCRLRITAAVLLLAAGAIALGAWMLRWGIRRGFFDDAARFWLKK